MPSHRRESAAAWSCVHRSNPGATAFGGRRVAFLGAADGREIIDACTELQAALDLVNYLSYDTKNGAGY